MKQFHPNLSENRHLLLMEFLLHGLAEFSQVSKSYLDNGFAFKDMFNSLFNAEFNEEDDDDSYDDMNRY